MINPALGEIPTMDGNKIGQLKCLYNLLKSIEWNVSSTAAILGDRKRERMGDGEDREVQRRRGKPPKLFIQSQETDKTKIFAL